MTAKGETLFGLKFHFWEFACPERAEAAANLILRLVVSFPPLLPPPFPPSPPLPLLDTFRRHISAHCPFVGYWFYSSACVSRGSAVFQYFHQSSPLSVHFFFLLQDTLSAYNNDRDVRRLPWQSVGMTVFDGADRETHHYSYIAWRVSLIIRGENFIVKVNIEFCS